MFPKIAVLVSGYECSTLSNLIRPIAGFLDAKIACVISSNANSLSSQIAEKKDIPHYLILRKDFDNSNDYCEKIYQICDQHDVLLMILAGWLIKLKVPKRYENRILNIHPSLLPKYGGKGMYGIKIHRAVLKAEEEWTGATIHIVDNEYDNGPIVAQERLHILLTDTPEILQKIVKTKEKNMYPKTINRYLREIKDKSNK